nr:MAG TPA: hypothetical protein [Caudoviricetes sp.]
MASGSGRRRNKNSTLGAIQTKAIRRRHRRKAPRDGSVPF